MRSPNGRESAPTFSSMESDEMPAGSATSDHRAGRCIGLRLQGWTVAVLVIVLLALLAAVVVLSILLADAIKRETHREEATAAATSSRVQNPHLLRDPDFEGSFKLKTKAWDPRMADINSDVFGSAASTAERMIDQVYLYSNASQVVNYTVVTGLRAGSVQVNFIIQIKAVSSLVGNPGALAAYRAAVDKPGALAASFYDGVRKILAAKDNSAFAFVYDVDLSTFSLRRAPLSVTLSTAGPPTSSEATDDYWRRCGEVRVQPDFRIVGGSAVAEGGFPWLAMLEVGGQLCGASIIDRHHLITAAHCLERLDQRDQREAVAGIHETDSSTWLDHAQRRHIAHAYMHEDYVSTVGSGGLFNDVAIVRLSSPLEFNSRVAPICLPGVHDPLPSRCTVAGWGWTQANAPSFPSSLQAVTLWAYNSTACRQTFHTSFREALGWNISRFLSDDIVCAANHTSGGLDACSGDSGGPLFCLQPSPHSEGQRYVQFGVTSTGEGCGLPGCPGFYTFLPSYLHWITHVAIPTLDFMANADSMVCLNRTRCVSLLPNITSDLTVSDICSVLRSAVDCMVRKASSPPCRVEVAVRELWQYLPSLPAVRGVVPNLNACQASLLASDGGGDVCEDATSLTLVAIQACRANATALPRETWCLHVWPKMAMCVADCVETVFHRQCSADRVEWTLSRGSLRQQRWQELCPEYCEDFRPDKCEVIVERFLTNSSMSQSDACGLMAESLRCVQAKQEGRGKVCQGDKLRLSLAAYIGDDVNIFAACDDADRLVGARPVCEDPVLLGTLARSSCSSLPASSPSSSDPCVNVEDSAQCVVKLVEAFSIYCPLTTVQRNLKAAYNCSTGAVSEPTVEVLPAEPCTGDNVTRLVKELAQRHCHVVRVALDTFQDTSALVCREVRNYVRCVSRLVNHQGVACTESDVGRLASGQGRVDTALLQQCHSSFSHQLQPVTSQGVCADPVLVKLYGHYTCPGLLHDLTHSSPHHFCRNLAKAVLCANTTLTARGYKCAGLTATLYRTLTPNVYYLGSYDQCPNDTGASLDKDARCKYFSIWCRSLSSCHSLMKHTVQDGQCRGVDVVAICVQRELGKQGVYCWRQDVLDTLVSTLVSYLGQGQQVHCQGLNLPRPPLKCKDPVLIGVVTAKCSEGKPCMSMLELTLCIQRHLDSNWLECGRYDTEQIIKRNYSSAVNICQEYAVRVLANSRVFSLVDRRWLVACGDGWGPRGAAVVCRQLGYRHGTVSTVPWTQANLVISPDLHANGWMHVTCSGQETSLADCQIDSHSLCSRSSIGAAVCFNKVNEFRLKPASPDVSWGTVQLSRDAGQGDVCVVSVTDRVAGLLCQAAGYLDGLADVTSSRTAPAGPVWTADLACDERATNVHSCVQGGGWTLRGGVSQAQCVLAQVDCFPGHVRFHNGLRFPSGVVQLYLPPSRRSNLTLTSVCRDDFSNATAALVCRQMGWSRGGQALSFNPFYVSDMQYVTVFCTGGEQKLEDCQTDGVAIDDGCSGPAVAKCIPDEAETVADFTVKLLAAGQVLVHYGGQWGTVCADQWTVSEAMTVCRQLGHRYGYPREAGGPTPHPHVLQGVGCGRNMTAISQCEFTTVESDVCQHYPPAAVLCTNSSRPVVSLTGGRGSNEGHVMVDFRDTEAHLVGTPSTAMIEVMCQSLGFVTGQLYDRDPPTVSTDSPSLLWRLGGKGECGGGGLDCLHEDLELVNCTDRAPASASGISNDSRCDLPRVSVFCYKHAVRLHAGPHALAGFVQFYRDGSWWEACTEQMGGMVVMDRVCREVMDSPSALAIDLGVGSAFFNTHEERPTYITTTCSDSQPDVDTADCVTVHPGRGCITEGRISAAVVCFDGEQPSGDVEDQRLAPSGLYLVRRYGVWGTLCYSSSDQLSVTQLCHDTGSQGGDTYPVKSPPTLPVWANGVACFFGKCTTTTTGVTDGCNGDVTGMRCYNDTASG